MKLIWTVDWEKVNHLVEDYVQSCHILFVQIDWKSEFGGMYLIPISAQKQTPYELGKVQYIKKNLHNQQILEVFNYNT